jgi:SAM-dependent methyltransferase
MVTETGAEARPWRRLAGNHLMYDTMGAAQFSALALLFGLRETHKLLEIGSGPLRAARFLIMYLDEGNYCGVEPNEEAVELGLRHEVGEEIVRWKKPRFISRSDFGFHEFGETFDYALSYSLLTHVPPGAIPTIFDNLARCFHDRSMFLATASFREEEEIVDPDTWTSLPINHYAFSRIEAAANGAGMLAARLGKIHQDWFIAYRAGNPVAEVGIEEMNKVDWSRMTPRWVTPPGWGTAL